MQTTEASKWVMLTLGIWLGLCVLTYIGFKISNYRTRLQNVEGQESTRQPRSKRAYRRNARRLDEEQRLVMRWMALYATPCVAAGAIIALWIVGR